MQTKDRILEAALRLYNEGGVNVVTTRHIAASLQMSPGNLHYHFKHTDDIIKTLYDALSAEFDQLSLQAQQLVIVNLQSISIFTGKSLEVFYKYRFIFLGFVDIAIRIPAIKKDYEQLNLRRQKEFKLIFKNLVKSGVFRSDIPDAVWSALVTQIFIVGDFWLSNNELTKQLRGHAAIRHYKKLFDAMFFPYLA